MWTVCRDPDNRLFVTHPNGGVTEISATQEAEIKRVFNKRVFKEHGGAVFCTTTKKPNGCHECVAGVALGWVSSENAPDWLKLKSKEPIWDGEIQATIGGTWRYRFEWNAPGHPGWSVMWSTGERHKVDEGFTLNAKAGLACLILWHVRGLKYGLPEVEQDPSRPGFCRVRWAGCDWSSWRSAEDYHFESQKEKPMTLPAAVGQEGQRAIERVLGLS